MAYRNDPQTVKTHAFAEAFRAALAVATDQKRKPELKAALERLAIVARYADRKIANRIPDAFGNPAGLQ